MEDHSMSNPRATVEMPRPTAAPLVLAAGIVMLTLGIATSPLFLPVGGVIFVVGLGLWIAQLLPGRGHFEEALVEAPLRPEPIRPAPGPVERLAPGVPGYRLRLPVRVHPVSAGIKGGLAGGLIMTLPALAYGVLSGRGIWWAVNLLAGMLLPSVGAMGDAELGAFHPTLFIVAVLIHLVNSFILGLIYGVLMPTLPDLPKPFAWGALLMPLAWTGAAYVALGIMNPGVRAGIEWAWFVVSQLVFGIVAAIVFTLARHRGAIKAGLLAGIGGGLLMPIPALLWSLATRHGIWYPANLLAAMAIDHGGEVGPARLEEFHPEWLTAALLVHVVLSLTFGLALALVLPRMPTIPSPIAWGGLLLPLLWTALSYGLMGVVNPVLQERVDWPWFVVSQFIFGIVAAVVVIRSEQIHIPPAGAAPDVGTEFLTD